MAAHNFEACLQFTLQYEGGYVDHPADPGGATNLGITRATLARWRGGPVTKAAVRALKHEEAAAIYRRFYWSAVAGDTLPAGLDACVFDHAVHAGPARAIRALQKALGVRVDGRVGPATRAALVYADPTRTLLAVCRSRRASLARLRTFPVFGRGWNARLAALEKTAITMARGADRPSNDDFSTGDIA